MTNPKSQDHAGPPVFIDARGLCGHPSARYGKRSVMYLTRLVANSGFPKPYPMGGKVRLWKLAEVIAWEESQRAAS